MAKRLRHVVTGPSFFEHHWIESIFVTKQLLELTFVDGTLDVCGTPQER